MSAQECESVCTTASFCAICDESENCVEIAMSEQECNVTDFCILKDGTILVNVSQSECQTYGQCSQPCPIEVTVTLLLYSDR